MKSSYVVILIILAQLFVFSGCEKENKEENTIDPTIQILTGKSQYFINENIDLKLTNQLDLPVNYFICDQIDLAPMQVLLYTNGGWIEMDTTYLCTSMGPMGYFGVLDIMETENDTFCLFNMTGTYKLKYEFLLGEYFITYCSNEFEIRGGEL